METNIAVNHNAQLTIDDTQFNKQLSISTDLFKEFPELLCSSWRAEHDGESPRRLLSVTGDEQL